LLNGQVIAREGTIETHLMSGAAGYEMEVVAIDSSFGNLYLSVVANDGTRKGASGLLQVEILVA
jgi:hypothetical protein